MMKRKKKWGERKKMIFNGKEKEINETMNEKKKIQERKK